MTTSDPFEMGTIFLTGFMGTGKSTVGLLLAKRIGYCFIDLDEMISEEAGANIPEIFAKSGEEGFRDMETSMLRRLADRDGLIISTGGGAVLRDENRRIMRDAGHVINLTASVDALSERLADDDSRPLLQCDEPIERIITLLAQREPMYRDCDVQIDTSHKSPDEILDEILTWLKKCKD